MKLCTDVDPWTVDGQGCWPVDGILYKTNSHKIVTELSLYDHGRIENSNVEFKYLLKLIYLASQKSGKSLFGSDFPGENNLEGVLRAIFG